MDQTKSVNELNIKRFRNLLETSINEVERLMIQKLLTEEEAKNQRNRRTQA
jgi:hypothetical protein